MGRATRAANQVPPPAGPRDRRVLGFIAAYLILQLALPLRYYLGRPDRLDERFAWRMFSAERQARCRPRFRVGDDPTPVRLSATFHEGWIAIAERGRRDVLEAMAARLCGEHPADPVRLEMTCEVPGAPPRVVSGGHWDLCPDGRL